MHRITHALIVLSVKSIVTFKGKQKIHHLSVRILDLFIMLPCLTKLESKFKEGGC